MKTCKNCGAVMTEEDSVCSLCGESLPKKIKRSTAVIIIIAAVLLLAFIAGISIFLILGGNGNAVSSKKYASYETLVKDYYTYKASGNGEGVYSLVNDQEKKAFKDENKTLIEIDNEADRLVSLYGKSKVFIDEINPKQLSSSDIEDYESNFANKGFRAALTEDNFTVADITVTLNGTKGINTYEEQLLLYKSKNGWSVLIPIA